MSVTAKAVAPSRKEGVSVTIETESEKKMQRLWRALHKARQSGKPLVCYLTVTDENVAVFGGGKGITKKEKHRFTIQLGRV